MTITLINEETHKGVWTRKVFNVTWKDGVIFANYIDDKGQPQTLHLTPESVGDGHHVIIE